MSAAGVPDAAISLDQFMRIAGRTAQRRITVQCPSCSHVSSDEKRILYAASLAQSGAGHLAEDFLKGALLSASGAEFAFGPLESIGELFEASGFRFRQRRKPCEAMDDTDEVEHEAHPPKDHVVH